MIDEATTTSPLGSEDRYTLNEWSLIGAGDILLLHTDGLAEHRHGEQEYFPARLERTVRRMKDRTARAIYAAVREDLVAFGEPADDISLVVHQASDVAASLGKPRPSLLAGLNRSA
jgi:serine phosphatase RsbU (regulator of sigma subunit)